MDDAKPLAVEKNQTLPRLGGRVRLVKDEGLGGLLENEGRMVGC